MSPGSQQPPGEISEFDLGAEGLAHIRDQFAWGLTLARRVIETIELEAGRCYTLAPRDSSSARLRRFREGGLQREATGNLSLAERLPTILGDASSPVLVAENVIERPGDPSPPDDPRSRFTLGEEVYEYTSVFSVESVLATIRMADACFSLNAVVSTQEGDAAPLPQDLNKVSLDTFESIVRGVIVVMARAYDGEGFVVWERHRAA